MLKSWDTIVGGTEKSAQVSSVAPGFKFGLRLCKVFLNECQACLSMLKMADE